MNVFGMKPTVLVLISVFIFVSNLKSQADSIEKRIFCVKSDILFPSLGLFLDFKSYGLTIEVGFKNRHSIQVTGWKQWGSSGSYNEYTTHYLIEDYKLFLNVERHFSGFYTGIYCDQIFEHALADSDPGFETEYKTSSIGGGPIIGYQNYFKKRFVFDFIFGFGKSFAVQKEIIQGSVILFDSWPDLRLAFNIGYKLCSK